MRIRKLILPVILIAGAFFAYKHFAGGVQKPNQAAMGQMPPAQVDVFSVKEDDVILWNEFSGRLEAVDNIEVRPRISGMIEKVHFTDGQMVKRGDVLFTIDPAPYYADMKRAEGAKASAGANSSLAQTELARAEKLYAAKAISKQEYDARKAAANAGYALAKSAKGEAELAALNLSYTKVRAPISGKVGRAEVTKGNIVSAGQSTLTTLVGTAPIYASFEVDENTYLRASKPDSNSKVLLGLSSDEGFPYDGKIQGFDNQISPVSGSIRARAVFENKDGVLIPGLFAKIKIGSADTKKVILLDQKAINTDQDKKFVYVAAPNNTAEYRVITLGGEYEGKRIITSGLNVGDKVVVNGIQKIFMPGQPIITSDAKAETKAKSGQAAAK